MIKAFSQRLSPPYSGQVQIAESERARAITMDGESWEFQFRKAGAHQKITHGFARAAYIQHSELGRIADPASLQAGEIDERILELATFLADASLPFSATDNYEYWLLDYEDEAPLAMIFSCSEAEQMATYPQRTEWTALPAAVMQIEATEEEKQSCDSPVNYRLERAVAERAGRKPRARWFNRRENEPDSFPPFLLREDWQDEAQHALCQRYLLRQSPRLLMLHGLQHEERLRLEQAARDHVMEVQRFYPLYPEVADEELMGAIRVEARLRRSTEERPALLKRRDGVLYI